MNEIKVSVIVPIYNTEKFLRKCIESIVNQTLQEIEIILINDGSTDNSHNICLEYAEKYPKKIRYINNKNIGCSATRNLGIELSKGEYIAFVDSDDYIEKEMYEEMYKIVKNKNLDIVISGIIYENKYNKDQKKSIPQNINEYYSYFKINNRVANPVNKLIKKKLISDNKINFPIESHSGEDIVFCFKLLTKTKRVTFISRAYYYYVNHGFNSIYNLEKRKGIFISFKELYKYLLENNLLKDKELMKKFYELFNFYAIRGVFFMLLNPIQVSEKEYKKYNKIFYEELKKIKFLTLKSRILIFYYRNLFFLIRKYNLYFFLKKVKKLLKREKIWKKKK